jgi:cytochrome c biogenesis protein
VADPKCPGCGGAVSEGSQFCPSCGRALGSLERPRSRTETNGWVEFIDKCWDFFASTKVAAILIAIMALASMSGTLIEQESLYTDWRPPNLYYPVRYGPFWGHVYMNLGLTHAYSSIWFAALILLIVISLIICSFHRLVPLHRILTNPQVWKLGHFIKRQEVVYEFPGDLASVEQKLKRRGYKMVRDRECLYGDRGRLSRYGPYIIHIGLLVVAFAAFSKGLPGWDVTKDVWVADGDMVKVPDTNFAIKNYKFTMELHPNGAPKLYRTDAGIVQNGTEVLRRDIEVNSPLTFGGWQIFQASWREEPGVAHVQVMSGIDQSKVTDIAIDLRKPEQEYPVTDKIKLVVSAYYHDFTVDEATKEPTNGTFEVKNPVIMAQFVENGKTEPFGRTALIVLGNQTPIYEGPLYLKVSSVDTRWYTALKLHKDKTVLFMFSGLGIVLLGMAITFFFFHFQVWVREDDGQILLGARAYKNKFGLKQELKRLFERPDGEGPSA